MLPPGVLWLFLSVATSPSVTPADSNPIAHCICGGRQTLWGQPLGSSPPGVGELSLQLRGDAFFELCDPMGRWIRYDRGDHTYHADIPNAECSREPVETNDELDDDSTAVADTMHTDGTEYYEDLARVPGPLDGDYHLRVGHAPRAEWELFLYADGCGAPASTFNDIVAPARLSDTVSTYRLRWDLTGNTIVRVDSVGGEYLPPLRPSRRILRLQCEPDPFDTLPAPNARVELRGPGKPTLVVSLPDGENSYEATPQMISGGHHVGVEYEAYPAFRFEGAPRDSYLIGVEAEITGVHTLTVSTSSPSGIQSRSDSLMIHAGEKRYWHTTWFVPGSRVGSKVLLERGAVPQSAILTVPDSILAVGSEPALSPDGRRLAFVRGQGLWRMELATRECTLLGTFHEPHWPSWGPDGREVLFHASRSDRSPETVIWRVQSDGTRAHVAITPSSEPDTYPLWSPSGDRIVWTRGHRLWVADSSGAEAHALRTTPARVFERASEWTASDDAILYSASDGARGGPQYLLRRVLADGSHDRALVTNPRAEDGRAIPGTMSLLTSNGRRLFIVEDVTGIEPVLVAPGHETAGFHRSRVALSSDGKRAYTDGDPGPNGEPVILTFDLPIVDTHYLMRRWREGLVMLGADSTTVQAAWGAPHAASTSWTNVRVWSYSLRKRGEPDDGWLQFYFLFGKLWSVTRGLEPVRSFVGFP